MKNISLHSRLLQLLPELTTSEKKAANFILRHYSEIMNLSCREVAVGAEISLGSVVKFAKRLGFSGYKALTIAIAHDVGFSADKSPPTEVDPYFRSLMDTIQATAHTIDVEAVDKAAGILADASSIVLFGGGNSGRVCHIATDMFANFGKMATSFDQLSTLRSAANYVDTGCAVLVMSHRGTEPAVIETLKACRSRGGRTICITNSSRNPLAKECEVALETAVPYYGSHLDLISEPVREIQMAVIRLLVIRSKELLNGTRPPGP